MKSIRDWNVYLVTDRKLAKGRALFEICEASIKGGVSVIQIREKNLDSISFYREGLSIKNLLREHDIPFIVNDRIDIALALGADGVHLGQSDVPVKIARDILGPDKIIGWSVEKPDQIVSEEATLADYLALSPIFFTSTKSDIAKPWGIEGIRIARSMTRKPLVAIGGICETNLAAVVGAGVDVVAMVSAIVSAGDVELATRSLTKIVVDSKSNLEKP